MMIAAEKMLVASLLVASSLLDQQLLLEKPIVEAASLFDGVAGSNNQDCLRKFLATRPITDSKLGTKTKEPFFKTSRPIPTVGNALRASIDDYERTRRYDAAGLEPEKTSLYYQRAKATAIANLDYLDLLRNAWLDALQDLDALLASTDEPNDAEDSSSSSTLELQAALAAVNTASREYLRAAQISLPPKSSTESQARLCR